MISLLEEWHKMTIAEAREFAKTKLCQTIFKNCWKYWALPTGNGGLILIKYLRVTTSHWQSLHALEISVLESLSWATFFSIICCSRCVCFSLLAFRCLCVAVMMTQGCFWCVCDDVLVKPKWCSSPKSSFYLGFNQWLLVVEIAERAANFHLWVNMRYVCVDYD